VPEQEVLGKSMLQNTGAGAEVERKKCESWLAKLWSFPGDLFPQRSLCEHSFFLQLVLIISREGQCW